LWNAGVLMGELVGGKPQIEDKDRGDGDEDGWKNGGWWVDEEEEKRWNVEGETVLELGAGGLG
jgi:hypothetical protein